jgi:hypothetical protein
MLVSPYPGAHRKNVRESLGRVKGGLLDVKNAKAGWPRLVAYLTWATDSARLLEHQLTPADVRQLIFTPGYERLLSSGTYLDSSETGTAPVLNGLLTLEITQREEALGDAFDDLHRQIEEWTGGNMVFALPDTSFYMEHEQLLRELDFAPLVDEPFLDHPIRVLVPLIILDELEGLKRKGENQQRWRAAYTLSVIDDLFKGSNNGTLRTADPVKDRGPVVLDILWDAPGHLREAVNDNEIIAQGLAAQSLAAVPVTLLTFDTPQSLRARRAHLPEKNLSKPVGNQPPAPRRKRPHRQATSGNGAVGEPPPADS